MLKRIRNNKILLLILLVFLVVATASLGRFIYLEVKKNFFLSKDFYFESDKLREKQFLYRVNNYNGVDNYDIVVNMNSIKNNMLRSKSDIAYDISISCSAKANCSQSKANGVIYAASGTDYFSVSLSPSVTLAEKDEIHVTVTASSTEPYVKTLSATFILVVGNYGLSYEIDDEVNRPYLEFKMTNTLDYYTVKEAFGTYSIDSKIDIPTYLALSDEDKSKCASAIINLAFDPAVILFDNASLVKGLIGTTTTSINNFDYVNGLSFKIDAISSMIVRFYKKNKAANYTYPIVNQNPIINVTYE